MPTRQRSTKISIRELTDPSLDSPNIASDDASTGSYSLGNSSSTTDNNRTQTARTKPREYLFDPLDNQKSRRPGLRKTGSRSSEITKQLDRVSPHLRGRKKVPSEIPCDDSLSIFSLPSYSPISPANARSKSRNSTSKRDDDLDDTTHSGRRKTRSKSRVQRSSSGKGKSLSEKPKRHSRRSRTPSKNELKPPNSDSPSYKRKVSVTEEELLKLLDASSLPPLATKEDETRQRPMRSRRSLSKSPAPDSLDAANRERKNGKQLPVPRRRRSISDTFETKPKTIMRRGSIDGDGRAKEKRTRQVPRRSRSNNIGIDRSALDSFLNQNIEVSQRKRAPGSSRSVISGSKNGNLSGARSVYSTNSAVNRRRQQHFQTSQSNRTVSSDTRPRQPRRNGHPTIFDSDEDDDDVIISDSEGDDSDDGGSIEVDLDLATARINFVQQNINEKLQKHLNKTDELLYSVFPKHIADALRNGKKVAPENHDMVTIFFSDIVGFTDISAKLDPLKISDMLDRLYNSFDALSDYHDVFKVETIGDAYMAVTNLTKEQPDHCKRITEFAVDAIRVANQTLIDEDNPSMGFVNIRVGFHSGSVVSNVVGTRNPRYCLFGDTVNTASRMESNSEKNRIHCSETSATLLRQQCPRMRIFPRGFIDVKGKGEMKTFWIHTEGSFSARDRNKSTIRNFMDKVFA